MNQPESSPPRIGCVYRPQFAPERLAATARAADSAGLDELWLWEDCFLTGGISTAAIALSNSRRLTVGVGVLPIPMRNVAATAMEVSTLVRAFPDRVRIGVGHGVQDWMAQIGEKVSSPMSLMREYVTCLSRLLDGERVTFHGTYVHLDDVELDWPPLSGPPLLIGAEGPKTLQLSGELATGTVITGGTRPDGLRTAIEHIHTGRQRRAQQPPDAHSIVTYLLCTTGPTAQQDLLDEIAHWDLEPGDDIGVHGTADQIAAAARKWVDAGADTIVLQPTADADIDDFVAFVGGEVRPVVGQR